VFHKQLTRTSATQSRLDHPYDFPAFLFATTEVQLERGAVDELLHLLELENTLERLYQHAPHDYDAEAHIRRVALTPDFHKGAGIPVGTVLEGENFILPQAVGNDIGCGMRLHPTSLSRDQLEPHLDRLEGRLRHMFFEGGRDIALTGRQRRALLHGGVSGLLESVPQAQSGGLWRQFQAQDVRGDLERMDSGGSLPAAQLSGLDDWIGSLEHSSRDSQIGSIGGGNHFVELQYVHKLLEPGTAHAWGLKVGQVTVMVHSGSLGVGHLSGNLARDAAKRAYPAGLTRPENGFYPLTLCEHNEAALEGIVSALNSAGNFAFVNRLFLALMVQHALEGLLGELDFPLLYDAPHNFTWSTLLEGNGRTFLHRKGATPARGFEAMQGTPFAYTGEPVLVPGSMGASSFVLAGRGLMESLSSASHGAGRQKTRGDAMRGHDLEFEQFLQDFRVVTPLDWKRARADVRGKKLEELKQEAPFAYKGIGPVVDTLEQAGMARAVVELRPLLTVKG